MLLVGPWFGGRGGDLSSILGLGRVCPKVLGSSGQICEPPLDLLGLYEKSFRAEMRLPFHPFFCLPFSFFGYGFEFSYVELMAVHLGLYSHCFLADVRSTILLFRAYFTFKRHPIM